MNTKGVEDEMGARVWIDPRTKEPCRRCDGTGKMPPWPGSKGLVACGVCRETQTAAVPVAIPSAPPTLPVPERTAEMEDLMASLRAAAENGMKSNFRDCYPLALATAPSILKLLDHIEGKG